MTGTSRQEVLILHTASTSLRSEVVAWAFYGSGQDESDVIDRPDDAQSGEPPFPSVVAALQEGWKLLETPQIVLVPGREHETGTLPFQFVLTRDV